MKGCALLASLALGLVLALWACAQTPELEATKRAEVEAAAVQAVGIVRQQRPGAEDGTTAAKPARLLVSTRTNSFRHESIGIGKVALQALATRSGAFTVEFSEGLELFEREALAQFDAVLFLNTTGELFLPPPAVLENLDAAGRAAALATEARLKENFRAFIEAGGGFIGIHAATDTFHQWPWYLEMIGAEFDGHPWGSGAIVSLRVAEESVGDPLVAMWPAEPWSMQEEIYQHKQWTAGRQQRLLRLDTERTNMTVPGIHRTDGDFPISWTRRQGQGRVFYCELGHNEELYWDWRVLAHYLAGVQWVLDRPL